MTIRMFPRGKNRDLAVSPMDLDNPDGYDTVRLFPTSSAEPKQPYGARLLLGKKMPDPVGMRQFHCVDLTREQAVQLIANILSVIKDIDELEAKHGS